MKHRDYDHRLILALALKGAQAVAADLEQQLQTAETATETPGDAATRRALKQHLNVLRERQPQRVDTIPAGYVDVPEALRITGLATNSSLKSRINRHVLDAVKVGSHLYVRKDQLTPIDTTRGRRRKGKHVSASNTKRSSGGGPYSAAHPHWTQTPEGKRKMSRVQKKAAARKRAALLAAEPEPLNATRSEHDTLHVQ